MNVTYSQTPKKIVPSGLYVEQNKPNPFSKMTSIKFSLPCQAKVSIVITNSNGKVVDKLISNLYEPGIYNLEFFGDGLPDGTYFCHLVADQFSDSRELELLK